MIRNVDFAAIGHGIIVAVNIERDAKLRSADRAGQLRLARVYLKRALTDGLQQLGERLDRPST